MKLIENEIVKEKVYMEKLEEGLTVMIIPKKDIKKKYAIIGTHFGSIDNEFIVPGENKQVKIPDGVAHFLEHKMFEQENGINSLDALTSLGVDANAFTSNDYTAYLFEGTNNFEEAFDELMDYVQHPYFTDENVEKEKGIIVQELNMYLDDPGMRVYMEALQCMYKDHPIRIDIVGTEDSINSITKETLYNCYKTFYNLSNMALVLCGDFNPEETIKLIKSKIIKNEKQDEIKRIYPKEDEQIFKKESEIDMNISQPLFVIGIKEDYNNISNKKIIGIEILLQIMFGKSSNFYKRLYENGELIVKPELDYEFGEGYCHIMISGQAKNPRNIYEEVKKEIEFFKNNKVNKEDFERIKKKVYGSYIMEYDDVGSAARMFLGDYLKGIDTFEYINSFECVNLEYVNSLLNDNFDISKMVLSIVK